MKWDMAKTKEILSFLCKLLENFCFAKNFKIYSNTSPHWWNFLPWLDIMIKTFYICYLFLCWALSNFVDPCWETYHAFKIKITYMSPNISTTPTLGVVTKTCLPLRFIQKCSTPTLGVNKNMFVRFHQNKCSKSLLISNLKSFVAKKAWGYHKKEMIRKKRRKERWE